MNSSTNKLLSLILAIVIAFASISMIACGGGSQNGSQSEHSASAEESQDNCYGDDLPALNNN
ncbi:MAG: hypothetical protein IJ125_00085 [Atopobiaceae bacterium]|nr:hypothetical protein [Atopobiaceae bacterium]